MPPLEPPNDDNKPKPTTPPASDEAVQLIRAKIDALYQDEPSAKEELAEAKVVRPRSKHQEFMYKLSTSGKPLAQIQTEWHEYYKNLSDQEKHEVWQEFYRNHAQASQYVKATKPKPEVTHTHLLPRQSVAPKPMPEHQPSPRTTSDIKNQLLGHISKRARPRKQHLKSLGFGLAMGFAVLLITMFGFFNEKFIAPLITPSRNVSSTPIIADTTSAVGTDPKVIIPKINVEIPVVYDEPSIDEHAVQRALEKGVLHYATTSNPGEQGNAVIFGHSSNNILNKGKYKFAFVLLKRLEPGDTFMLEKEGKRYIYKVFEKKIVPPTDVTVLANRDRPTATLITCDPPGTSVNRLIVVGEQISPDPASNVASTANNQAIAQPPVLPSNAPTLWSRFWSWISG